MIELYLSTDGKHTMHVSADDPDQMNRLVPYARELYDEVLKEYGDKAQMWDAAINGKGRRTSANGKANGQARFGKRVDTVEQAEEAVAPRCPEHDVPMAYRQGRFGPFYSCKVKENGRWCPRTQEISRPTNGESAPGLHA